MGIGRGFWLAIVAFVASIGSAASLAQNAALLPDAQKLLDDGLQSAYRDDWRTAASDFVEARKLAGNDPRILLDLGIAHARLGHEVAAIAWLNAFRSAQPNAPNAIAVQEAVRQLKESIRSKVSKLFSIAKDRASASKDKTDRFSLQQIAQTQEALGDFLGATETLRFAYNLESKAKLQRLEPVSPFLIDTNEMRLNFIRTRVARGDFVSALQQIKETPTKDRDNLVETAISQLLSSASFRAFTPEEVQAVQTLSSLLSDVKKAKNEKAINHAILRSQIEAKFSKNIVDTDAIDRYTQNAPEALLSLLWRSAQIQIDKKEFPAAEKTLQRMEELKDSESDLAILWPYLAEKYLEAGDRDKAVTAIKRVVTPLARIQDKNRYDFLSGSAALQAFDGNYSEAMTFAQKLQTSFYQIWTGDPDFIGFYRTGFGEVAGPEPLVGVIAFCAAMNGHADVALDIAKRFSPVAEFQLAYTNVAYADLLQHTPEKALQILETMPVVKPLAILEKAQLLGLIIQDALKRGDFNVAQRAVHAMPEVSVWKNKWAMGVRFEVEAALALAKTFFAKGDAKNATKMAEEEIQKIRSSQADVNLQRLAPDHLDGLLERVALAEESFGDKEKASVLRGTKSRPISDRLQSWINFANGGIVHDPQLLDPDKKLLEIQKAKFVPTNIAELARSFGTALEEINRLEIKTGLSVEDSGWYRSEDGAWHVLSSTSPDANDYRAFFLQFPQSARRAEIEKKIASLGQGSVAPAQAAPQEAAKQTISSYRPVGTEYSEGVSISPDGRKLSLAGSEITAWDIEKNQLLFKSEKINDDRFRAVSYSPDGHWLLGDADWQRGIVKLIDAQSGKTTRDFQVSEYNGFLYNLSISFSTDSRYFVTNFWTKANYGLKIFDVQSGSLFRTIVSSSKIYSVAFSPDNRQVAGGSTQLAAIWDTQTGKLLHPLVGHTATVNGITYSPDGRLLVTGSVDKTVKVWDPTTGQLLRTMTTAGQVGAVTISPDARFVAALIDGKAVNLYDLTNGALTCVFAGGSARFTGIAFSPTGLFLGASTTSGAVIWRLDGELDASHVVARPAVASIQALAPEQPHKLEARTASPVTPSAASSPDESAWNLINETIDKSVLRRFIEEFPTSPHRAEAAARLKQLADLPKQEVPVRSTVEKSKRSRHEVNLHAPSHLHSKQCFMFNGRRVCD